MADAVDHLVNAVNSHDLQGTLRCYVPEAVVVGPEMKVEGADEIASYHAHVWDTFPDGRLHVWEKITEGQRVALEGAYVGTQQGPLLLAGGAVAEPTRHPVVIRFCWLFTTEDGLILSHRIYHDQMEIYSQVGVRLPPDLG